MSIKIYYSSSNLFNENSERVSGYVNSSGNIVEGGNPIWTYDFFPIAESTYYTYKGNQIESQNYKTIRVAWYNSNHVFLTRDFVVNGADVAHTLISPQGASYARLSIDADVHEVTFNSGSTALPYEPYGKIWKPCTVKRYTSREEMNTSVWQKAYKGSTLTKNGADIALSINTTGGRGASVSTDQFYKDNCSIKLAANETYSITAKNNIAVGSANVVVRYLDTNEIIASVSYGELPEGITLTPNVETYIYFGVDISVGAAAIKETATINVIRQSAWHDTPVYVRENSGWVEQTQGGI